MFHSPGNLCQGNNTRLHHLEQQEWAQKSLKWPIKQSLMVMQIFWCGNVHHIRDFSSHDRSRSLVVELKVPVSTSPLVKGSWTVDARRHFCFSFVHLLPVNIRGVQLFLTTISISFFFSFLFGLGLLARPGFTGKTPLLASILVIWNESLLVPDLKNIFWNEGLW